MKVKSLSHVRLLATTWTAAYQTPPSTGFSRQEYWSGVPLPSPKPLYTALISDVSKVMLKILHARLQHFQTKNFQMSNWVQKRQRNQRSNCQHLLDHRESNGIPEKYLCLINYAKAFDCMDHNKLWKSLKERGTPDHLTCFLRNLYSGQEATVRSGHGTTDWFK